MAINPLALSKQPTMASAGKRSPAAPRHRPSAASAAVAAILAAVVTLGQHPAAGELVRLQQAPKSDGSLAVLVVGDWGRGGNYNQSRVAAQMGKRGDEMDADFVISVGDNFYETGLSGVHDKAFKDSFTNIYTAKSLQKPWYTVLGNHDYKGDVLAQLSPDIQKRDNRFLCMRSFILNAGTADFFFIDTTPFVLEYWVSPGQDTYDWRDVAPRDAYISNLLTDLDYALKQSTAPWKVVVGHHPVRSVSEHGDTKELLESLVPVLKENGVDLYVNGHDHCLQHISSNDSPIQYLTSGGGSKAWRGIENPSIDKLRFFYDGQGFMSLQFTKTAAQVSFYDAFGGVLYNWSLSKVSHECYPGL